MTEKEVQNIINGIIDDNLDEKLAEIDEEKKTLPLLAIRGKVLFPKTILNLDIGRQASISAVNMAVKNKSEIFITSQKNALIDNPKKEDLAITGVVAKIQQIIKGSNAGIMKLSVQALYRAKIYDFIEDNNACFVVQTVKRDYFEGEDTPELQAYLHLAKKMFYEFTSGDKRINKELISSIMEMANPNEFIDNALSVSSLKDTSAQSILDIDDTLERLQEFVELYKTELEIAKIERQITAKVRTSIDKSQKEFYLREQLKAIHSELGDDPEEGDELLEQIKNLKLPKEIEEKALKEVKRLDKINPSSPDYSIILNYLEWLKELPFNASTEDTANLKTAKEILDGDHFGLEKVKQRILEHIAVLQLTKQIKGPILCLVGPPGVGKTSVATSIARALNRKFVRMSLGGVKDESEIRGHRRTYVGAMPGRIIYGLKNAGSNNPVFLLDEIDKLSSDIHGDPSSALLEVLDPEQNTTFRDRYLEVPFDLSKVMFITTANTTETIPYPLLDRMEVIELTGYTNEEKLQIAKQYLIPKQLKQNGITDKKIEFTDDGIMHVISGYTMEAGVRNLEREIGSIVRKVATKVAENSRLRKQIISQKTVENYLGTEKHLRDMRLEKDGIGACTGLAWTRVGGTTLTIEVGLMPGKGEIVLTGKLGDVMKESARAAISYIRANAKKYKVDESAFEKTDIHVHIPEGATPKDGPSAGITMATAILSAFIGKPVRCDLAMTGEITLHGKILAIGGLKEKALAAYRQGIREIIIPGANKKDLIDIPKEIRKEIVFITCDDIEQVFKKAIRF